jgi:beta-galactosidase
MGAGFSAVFDLLEGKLCSYELGSRELVKTGPDLNFWRAPTDNDFGNWMQMRCKDWKTAGKNSTVTNYEVNEISSSETMLTFYFDLKDVESTARTEYLINGNGDIKVKSDFMPGSRKLSELPRFGMNMNLNDSFDNVSWYGRGPQENYWDRKSAALVGNYKASVADLYFPYIRPQENGYRTDIRWVSFVDSSGTGLKFTADSLICFSAHHNFIEDFDPGDTKTGRHTIDIKKRNLININIDYGQTGVGGDDSWGARAYKHYTLFPQKYTYEFTMSPIKGN